MYRLFFLFCLLTSSICSAAEIQTLQSDKVGDRYTLQLLATIQVPEETLRQVLLDPVQVMAVNDAIVGVVVLPSDDDRVQRFRDHTRVCIFLFCFDYRNTLQMRLTEAGDIRLDIEPEDSDFHYGKVIWKTRAIAEDSTEVSFDSESEPAFSLPAFISLPVYESRMQSILLDMLQNIECQSAKNITCRDSTGIDSTDEGSL